MQFTRTPSPIVRIKGELPPSGPLPAALQTLAGWYLPYAYPEYCHAQLGDRFTVYPLHMPPLVFLSDPQDIRAILATPSTELHPGEGANVLAPLIGDHAFMLLEEDAHTHGRKVITPAFHQNMVKDQTVILKDIVEREIATWPMDTVLPIHPYTRALTLRVILRAIFSDADVALGPLHQRLMDMLSVSTSLMLQEPNLRHLPGWRAKWRGFARRRSEVEKLIYGLMNQRRADNSSQEDLLDMLLAAKNDDGSPISDRKIRDDLMSMIVAGHETTTGELAWAFQLLAHNPHVQDRLIEELDGGAGEEGTKGDEYLTATVHETLRRRPVFLFAIPRKVVEPVEIGGWTYRPPVHLAGCTYLMHHNPDLFPKPHEFRPERFIEETQQARTWLPWGGGRKHCLGRHFALMEVKAILREVLSSRRVLPAGTRIERPRWRSAILVPHAGGRVILRERRVCG
jgi:cytochrome P450 family 135